MKERNEIIGGVGIVQSKNHDCNYREQTLAQEVGVVNMAEQSGLSSFAAWYPLVFGLFICSHGGAESRI